MGKWFHFRAGRNASKKGNPFGGWRLCAQRNGYTLVETLVAVMLLAIALTVIMQQFSGAMNTGRAARDYTRAVWYAREMLAELRLADGLTPRIERGVFEDGYQWEATVEPYAADSPIATPNITAFLIRIQINWPSGSQQKQMAIDTIVLQQARG